MFNFDDEMLKNMGAIITTKEIKQQPELWIETWEVFQSNTNKINDFFNKIQAEQPSLRVIFTGAGTSAYVGDTILPYLTEKNTMPKLILESVPTTNIVSNPYQYFQKDIPTLLVSFARSGNSPESLVAVSLGEEIIDDFYQVTITCAANGKLAQNAQNDEKNLLLLMPDEANDQGFAMTGSFSCMTLTALLLFDTATTSEKKEWVEQISQMGKEVLKQEKFIQDIVDLDFNRIVYLGSGSLSGLAREAQLKVLELTAGKIATVFDSSMGFRHGPKSFVDNQTLVFDFISNNLYTQQYDIDIVQELQEDKIAKQVCAISSLPINDFSGSNFNFSGKGKGLPDAYLALPFVMFAQTVALLASVKIENKPDTPSPSGTVNRVVKGVTIHQYK